MSKSIAPSDASALIASLDGYVAQIVAEALAAPAVAQRDRHGALGVVLADDEAVEFRNDLAR